MKDYEQPPKVEFNKGRPFGIFISGLGQYNEGQLTGKWLYLPASKEEWKDALEAAGVGDKDSFGQPYEEYFITDTDIYCDPLIGKIDEYENLESLQLLAEKIDQMADYEYEAFCTYAQAEDLNNIADIYSLACNAGTLEGENYYFYPDVHDDYDLGKYVVDEINGGLDGLPKDLKENYFDYSACGRDLDLDSYETDNYENYTDMIENETTGGITFVLNLNDDELIGDSVSLEEALEAESFSIIIPEPDKENSSVVIRNLRLDEEYPYDLKGVDSLTKYLRNDSYLQNESNGVKGVVNELCYALEHYDPEDKYRYTDAGEFWCGDSDASHYDIGVACVNECGIVIETYFDYAQYGREIDMESQGEFTDNGYIEIVKSFTPGDELKEDLVALQNNNTSVIPSYKEMCKHFENKQKSDKNKVVDSIKPEKPAKSESLGKEAR